MTEAETILDTDLDAYVDNQLDATGRLRVETWLAQNPDAAARVMADLGMKTTLKLALVDDGASVKAETREAGRRLASGLADIRMWSVVRRIAAVAVLVSAGWLAHSSIGPFGAREVNASVPPPSFVEQAVRAHRTSELRAGMPSQPETKTYDREEIRSATAIVMPELPEDWQVADVQIFPSNYGPSVEMSVRTGNSERLSLFAVRPGHFSVEPIRDLNLSDAKAAWWQIGEVAYAVVSSATDTDLTDEAELLKNSLY